MNSSLLEFTDVDGSHQLHAIDLTNVSEFIGREPRVFVLPDAARAGLAGRLPTLVDKQPTNARTQPARVFRALRPGQCGIYRREYKHVGQLMRSLHTVLKRLRERRLPIACFLQIPDLVFKQLSSKARPAQPGGKRGLEGHAARMIRQVSDALRDDSMPDFLRERYVGDADCIERVRQMIWRVSEANEPVLIIGESGTGKEIVARCIHDCAMLRGRGETFNPINCGAVQATLFESELFGHSRGAFTGATQSRAGLWKSAGRGTLFLDEVADLAPMNQGKMLRSLQTGNVRPVGTERDVPVEARIISATNRDLHSMTLYGIFRSDLYHRLSTFRIVVPPLRQHPEDIGVIAQHLWRSKCGDDAPPLPEPVVDALGERDWPGNVRELHNVISVMRLMNHGNVETRSQAEAAIFYCDNPAAVFSGGRSDRLSEDAKHSATIRQLKGADRALDDAQNFFTTPRDLRGMDPDRRMMVLSALDDRRHELDQLTHSPLLFGSPQCFDAVNDAAGKLAYLLDLLHANPEAATSRDQRSVNKTIVRARELVQDQIEASLGHVRS